MALSSVHCSLAKILLELYSLLTTTLLQVLGPNAVNLEIFGEFIDIKTILKFLPLLNIRRLQLQHPD